MLLTLSNTRIQFQINAHNLMFDTIKTPDAADSLTHYPSAAFSSGGAVVAILLVTILSAPVSVFGQESPAAACNLVDAEALTAPLPDRFYDYELAESSVAPPVGDDPPESITVNVLYKTEKDEALFITVSHFCPGRRAAESELHWNSMVDLGRASKSTYRGHTAYMQPEPPAGAVHVGEDIEVGARAASPGAEWGDVEEAIELVRMAELEALATSTEGENPGAFVHDAPRPEQRPATDVGNAAKDRRQTEDGSSTENRRRQAVDANQRKSGNAERTCSFNETLRSQLPEELGGGDIELFPWAHPLTDEQVADAEIMETGIAFRKEGNQWLACIQRNDILWSPLASDARLQFLRRVLEITDADDRIIFQTRGAALTELFRRANIHIQGTDSTRH